MRIAALVPERFRRHAPAPDHWDHPGQAAERGRNGQLTPEARRRLGEAPARGTGRGDTGAPDLTSAFPRVDAGPAPVLRGRPGRPSRTAGALLAPPAGECPYPDIPAEQLAAYRLAAAREFLPAPAAAATAPMEALPANARVPLRPAVPRAARDAARGMPGIAPVSAQRASTGPEAARQLLDALGEGIDWHSLDAARKAEGLTYARARRDADPLTARTWPATEPARLGDALLAPFGGPGQPAPWRPPVTPAKRHGEAAGRRIGALDRVPYGADRLYSRFLRRVSAITGTTGIGHWRPVSGGAL